MTARSSNDGSLFIGLMSGTSLDGVDAVLADCSPRPPTTIDHRYHPFTDGLRAKLAALCASGPDELQRAGAAARELADVYAAAVEDLLRVSGVARSSVRAIGAHGQTVRHRPELGYSLQLNAPAWLAELTGIDVVADFRSGDIAAGGQGAPLASAFHVAAFSGQHARAVINLGGISNLTGMPASDSPDRGIVGFDCGPANLLLDWWTQLHFEMPFDRDGVIASWRAPDRGLLDALLEEPFFSAPPPKSTGRELFSPDWLERAITRVRGGNAHALEPEIVLATLTRLTSVVVASAIDRWFPQAVEVVVCGGGAHNRTLQAMLAVDCAPRSVISSSALGVVPDQVEALAFAWLAFAHLNRQPGNVPSVTGARGERVLGALYCAPPRSEK
ncbi:MAG: anhydro-N-acetylmuramic acid kinase [Burkholderiaceae bacterium]